MRTDYILYSLAIVFFLMTLVSFLLVTEQVPKSLWVLSTVVLGLFAAGLGYSQRPKMKTAAMKEDVHENESNIEKPATSIMTTAPAPVLAEVKATEPSMPTIELTQVKGIGAKRAEQLKSMGVNNVNDLAKISAEDLARDLKISPKITVKWVAGAKKLVK